MSSFITAPEPRAPQLAVLRRAALSSAGMTLAGGTRDARFASEPVRHAAPPRPGTIHMKRKKR
jgi:hypothetical protein